MGTSKGSGLGEFWHYRFCFVVATLLCFGPGRVWAAETPANTNAPNTETNASKPEPAAVSDASVTNAPGEAASTAPTVTNAIGLTNATAQPLTPGPTNANAEAKSAEKPRRAANTTNWLSAFRVKPGFRLEIVAEEPLVSSPVAMAFDENGRLFVAEMRDYPDRRNARPNLGRIRLLEDTDGEGVFSASTIYADNIPWPSAVAPYGGGLFVGATPQILYLKDSQGTGKADVRRPVFNGFGGTNASNADYLVNNFNWGLDNRIHGASGGIGGTVAGSDAAEGNLVSIADADFSFDPQALTLRAETGPAQSGLAFDSRGRKFLCDYMRPLVQAIYDTGYVARNPYFAAIPELADVTPPAEAIFRMTSDDLAKATRTLGSGAGAGRTNNVFTPGWLTHARGIAVYRGAAFPSNYFENVFIADPDAHVIHRVVLRQSGLQVYAERAPDERGSEFIMSADPSFRPAQIINGPGGILYVADLRDGADSGRIYRIIPANYQQPKTARLGKANLRELAAALSNPNGWERDTAARMIFERREPGSAGLMRDVLENASLPVARLHALHALEGIGALSETNLIRALQDRDAWVRQHALGFSGKLATNGIISDRLWAYVRALAGDISVQVRYQLAFTVGELRMAERPLILADCMRRDWNSAPMQTAALSSMGEGAGIVFSALAADASFRSPTAGLPFLREIAVMIGAQGRPDAVGQVLDWINRAAVLPPLSFALLTSVGEGLHRTGSSLGLVDPQGLLVRFYEQALSIALDPNVAQPARLDAIRLLGVSPYAWAQIGDPLLALLGSDQTYAVQSAALASIGRFSDPAIASNLVARLPALAPVLRTEAVSALMARTERLGEVAAALENGSILVSDLSYAQANLLRHQPDAELRGRAAKLIGSGDPRRPAVLDLFRPALRLSGVAARGREIFSVRCTTCHQLGGVGLRTGPDLAAVKVYGKNR